IRQLRRKRLIVVIEPPITFLPGLRLLTPELFAKAFANERMSIQLHRIMCIFASEDSGRGRNPCEKTRTIDSALNKNTSLALSAVRLAKKEEAMGRVLLRAPEVVLTGSPVQISVS